MDCSTTRANRFKTARENYQRIKKLLEQFKDEETQPSSDHFTEWNLEEVVKNIVSTMNRG